jgi:thioredoxin-dependent peroxiredoxin
MSIAVFKKAPTFSGVDQNGNSIALKQFIGQKVALYFYPQDDTPTCTVQACNLRDNFALLRKHQIQVIGISVDGIKSHKKFETKYQLPFPLIADEDKKIVEKYGVWRLKKFMGKEYIGLVRTTFLIDEKGKLVHIIEKPKSKQHAEEIIAAFTAVGKQ